MAEDSSFQLIRADRFFNTQDFEEFARSINLDKCGISYNVVSIIGAQNSGKSTLLNHLYKTSFKEMNPEKKCQTTQGIWMARGADSDPMTLILDVEGTDSEVREDDTAFEKQSTLFALAVSDIVLINLWYHSIGLQQASNKPLLTIVFQVLSQLFHGSIHKKTLLFIIRDIPKKASFDDLVQKLKADIQEIWDALPYSEAHLDSAFHNFFTLDVEALTSYSWDEERFKEQVTGLKKKIYDCISLSRNQNDKVPAKGFSRYSQDIWEKILKEGKNLNLPSQKQMIAIVCCEEIATEKFASLKDSEAWHQLEEVARTQVESGFGQKLHTLLNKCLSCFDSEALYFASEARSSKRGELESKILQLFHPAFESTLHILSSKILENFKETMNHALARDQFSDTFCDKEINFSMHAFDEGHADAAIRKDEWDVSRIKYNLQHHLKAYVTSCQAAKLTVSEIKNGVKKNLEAHLKTCFAAADHDTWEKIRTFLIEEVESAKKMLSSALKNSDIWPSTQGVMLKSLKSDIVDFVEAFTREVAHDDNVLKLMQSRFLEVYLSGIQSSVNSQNKTTDIKPIIDIAFSSSHRILFVVASIRLDDSSLDRLWPEVPPSKIIHNDEKCKILWERHQERVKPLLPQNEEATNDTISHDNLVALGRRVTEIMISMLPSGNLFKGVLELASEFARHWSSAS